MKTFMGTNPESPIFLFNSNKLNSTDKLIEEKVTMTLAKR